MWLYKGEELTDEMIPEKSVGFIYVITHKPTGRKYIGRKLLTRQHTRQKNKKIIRSRVESDWKTYWSSSPDLKILVDAEGTENFEREIMMFSITKGMLNYLEERVLHTVGALESDKYLNGNIRARIFKRNVLNKIDLDALNYTLSAIQQF